MTYLEAIGAVKTERREAESLFLLKALLRKVPIAPRNIARMTELAKWNKVLLRAAPLLQLPEDKLKGLQADVDEGFRLYDHMSKIFDNTGVDYVILKSFDSLPELGHDLDFLVPDRSQFKAAKDMLLGKLHGSAQELTHCDKLVGKFSCFLPGFTHDFEIYPTVSQMGEEYFDPRQVFSRRIRGKVQGREVWLMSDTDRAFIRIIHAMYRHNFLKLSDVIDFPKLIENCSTKDLTDRIDAAGMGDSYLFFLATEKRFLERCGVQSPKLDELIKAASERFGPDRLRFLQHDRLVLPYRIPTSGLIVLFLLKAGRDVARGRLRSAFDCLLCPPLFLLDFVNAALGQKLLERIW
jgi:hypothetical protein